MKTYYLIAIILFPITVFAQIFESELNSEGIVFPRLNIEQRDSLVAVEGQCIYNTDTESLDCYNGSKWIAHNNDGKVGPEKYFPTVYLANTFANPYSFDQLGNLDTFAMVNARSVEIVGDRIFLYQTYSDITEYDLEGNLVNTVDPQTGLYHIDFVVLPNDQYALLDNSNDSVYIIDQSGLLVQSIAIPNASPSLQILSGVVVNDKLILSENGNNELVYIDINTYQSGVFKDLSSLTGWIGDITFAHNKFYFVQAQNVFSLTASGEPQLIATMPTFNNTGIAVLGHTAYVCSNFGETIYEIDLTNNSFSVFKSGLTDRPSDIDVR